MYNCNKYLLKRRKFDLSFDFDCLLYSEGYHNCLYIYCIDIIILFSFGVEIDIIQWYALNDMLL